MTLIPAVNGFDVRFGFASVPITHRRACGFIRFGPRSPVPARSHGRDFGPVSWRGRRCLLGLLVWFCLTGLACAADLGADDRLQFADGLYVRGLYDLALQEYASFLKDFPQSDKPDVVYFRMGECHRHLNDAGAAEKAFRQVFVNYPASKLRLKAGFRRAGIFFEAKQYESAIDLYRAVLSEKPMPEVAAASLYFLAEALLAGGKTAAAAAELERLVKEQPGAEFHSYALLKLGRLYAESGLRDGEEPGDVVGRGLAKAARLQKAHALYGAAAEKPASPRVGAEALFQRAELSFKQKDYEQSAKMYGALLTRYPGDSRSEEAKLQAAWAAYNVGLFVDALKHAEQVLPVAGPDKREEWLYLRANSERQLVKHEAAVSTYMMLLKDFPAGRFADAARYESALAFYKMGRFEDAVAWAGKVHDNAELAQDITWLLAESYSALKDVDNAIQYYGLLIRKFPGSEVACDATYRLAHALQSRGAFREAAEHYGALVSTYPKRDLAPRALFASAFCLAKENRHEEAVRDLARLVKEYASSDWIEDALNQKAMSEVRLRRHDEALGTLRALLKRFPKTRFKADAHYWQGVLLKDQDKAQDAEAQLRQCLAAAPREDLARKARFELALVLHKTGKSAESAELIQPLLASPMKDRLTPALLEWLADYRFGRKEFKLSAEAAERLVACGPDPSWTQLGWYLVGRSRSALSDAKGAEAAFVKALDIRVTTRYASLSALAMGDLTLAAGRMADAVDHYNRAAASASDETLLDVRARAYVGLGRTAKAQLDMKAAARFFMSVAILYDDPVLVPECLFEGAAAFSALGDTEAAGRAVAELMDRYPDSEWATRAKDAAGGPDKLP